jgi:methane monooxygenase component A alpha chain
MDLADYIEMAGLVRADGKTLVPQPHLKTDEDWLWTIDDIRRQQIEIRDPLRAVPIEQLRTLE